MKSSILVSRVCVSQLSLTCLSSTCRFVDFLHNIRHFLFATSFHFDRKYRDLFIRIMLKEEKLALKRCDCLHACECRKKKREKNMNRSHIPRKTSHVHVRTIYTIGRNARSRPAIRKLNLAIDCLCE